MATITLPNARPRRWALRKPADLRKRERVLIIDEETDDEEENFVGYWWASLPLAEIKKLPPEARSVASNGFMIWLWSIMGAVAFFMVAVGALFLLYQNMMIALTVGAMPGIMLGSAVGFVFGYTTRLRPLVVLKRHRAGRVIPVIEPIEVAPMLHGVAIDLFAIRASYMGNVVKQVGAQRIFSIANAAYRKQEFMGMLLAGLAMAGIILFAIILSTDPELTGKGSQAGPPPPVAEEQAQ